VTGPGLGGGVVGQEVNIVIQPFVVMEEDLNQKATFTATLTFQGLTRAVNVSGLDTFGRRHVRFTRNITGNYFLNVYLENTMVPPSPFVIFVRAGARPAPISHLLAPL
jgi:hypothetical protein